MAPQVFLSHSSLDKERFVASLAKRLRANGTKTWYDDWELLPSDSLIERIFEEGLGEADVVVIVLSANSINSRWVQEELNTAAILRIKGQCRILPVILDGINAPNVLLNTVHQRIADCSSYDYEFDRILAGVLGQSAKPAAGELPAFAKETTSDDSDGLLAASRFVLKQMTRIVVDAPELRAIGPGDLEQVRQEGDLSEHLLKRELSRLKLRGCADRRVMWGSIGFCGR